MFSFSTKVRYSEADASLRLSYPSIINYFQDCSIFHSEDLGIGIRFLQEEHRVWLMNSWQIQILRFPQFGEVLNVNTWPYDFKSMFGYRNFTMTDRDGTDIVVANSVWVYADTDTGRPTRLMPEYAARYPLEPAYPMTYAPRKIELPADGIPAAPIPVTVSHIDSNNHVNNGQYISMAAEYLPKQMEVHRLRAEYKQQAHLNDTLYPLRGWMENSCLIALNDENGAPYVVVEFQ